MWTTSALASEAAPYRAAVWRVVEGQHRISTNRLAENRDDQALLEALVEEVKPLMPPACAGLHFLLATPFRYGHAMPSRFRRARTREGIFYAAEQVKTALAEIAYHRLAFLARSPGVQPPRTVIQHTAFRVRVETESALDLTGPPFADDPALWANPNHYENCQRLGEIAREAGLALLRYASVRNEGGINVALLKPDALKDRQPTVAGTWHIRMTADSLTALAAFPSTESHHFTAAQFGPG